MKIQTNSQSNLAKIKNTAETVAGTTLHKASKAKKWGTRAVKQSTINKKILKPGIAITQNTASLSYELTKHLGKTALQATTNKKRKIQQGINSKLRSKGIYL